MNRIVLRSGTHLELVRVDDARRLNDSCGALSTQERARLTALLEVDSVEVDPLLREERLLLMATPADDEELDRAWRCYHEAVQRNLAARKAHTTALKRHARAEKAYRSATASTERRGRKNLIEAARGRPLPIVVTTVLIAEIATFAFLSNLAGLVLGVAGIAGLLVLDRVVHREAVGDPGSPPAAPDYESEVQPPETSHLAAERAAARRRELDALIEAEEVAAADDLMERARIQRLLGVATVRGRHG